MKELAETAAFALLMFVMVVFLAPERFLSFIAGLARALHGIAP